MDSEKIKKTFPCYRNAADEVIFDLNKLPDNAKQQNIEEVYRVRKKGKIDADAFCSTYEERKHNIDLDLNDPSSFSTSCFEKLRDAKQLYNCIKKRTPNPVIAKGHITYDSGFSLREKDKSVHKKGSHVDWWIFCEEHPEDYFEEWSDQNV